MDNPRLDKASKLVALNLTKFLDYFQIEYRKSGNRYSFPCPIHEGDNESGSCLYDNKSYVTFCCFTNCPSSIKKDGISFIKGLLSRTVETSFGEAVDFIYNFTNEKSPLSQAPASETNKYWFLDIVKDVSPKEGEQLTKEQIRSRLLIPSKYYLSRGFDIKTLDNYDVGECSDKSKKFYNRAVIPCYDLSGNRYEGCTSRSIFEKCPKCSYYHSDIKYCPITSYDQYRSSKWLHEGIESSRMLFNFWNAQEEIKKTHKVILVEGVMDCVRLSSLGIKNVVALYGNSLKQGQTELLDTCGTMDLICMLDNDQAGIKGARDIKEKYQKWYRIYYPNYKGKDVGELQTDQETEDIKKVLYKLGINNE